MFIFLNDINNDEDYQNFLDKMRIRDIRNAIIKWFFIIILIIIGVGFKLFIMFQILNNVYITTHIDKTYQGIEFRLDGSGDVEERMFYIKGSYRTYLFKESDSGFSLELFIDGYTPIPMFDDMPAYATHLLYAIYLSSEYEGVFNVNGYRAKINNETVFIRLIVSDDFEKVIIQILEETEYNGHSSHSWNGIDGRVIVAPASDFDEAMLIYNELFGNGYE